jgi:RNA 2',3'-cyclic 3'-phosphodiesterase
MRLFVALPLPRQTPSALAAWARKCGPQPALRWTPQEQLHITLHFLGEVADERVPAAVDALNGVAARSFEVVLDRLDVLGRTGILAVTAKLTPLLSALEVDVRSRIFAFGENQQAGREFHPHVTLARARRGESVPKLRSLPPLPELRFAASCFRLYRSELSSQSAVHTVVREWSLGSSHSD